MTDKALMREQYSAWWDRTCNSAQGANEFPDEREKSIHWNTWVAGVESQSAELEKSRARVVSLEGHLKEVMDDVTNPKEEWAIGSSIYRARKALASTDTSTLREKYYEECAVLLKRRQDSAKWQGTADRIQECIDDIRAAKKESK